MYERAIQLDPFYIYSYFYKGNFIILTKTSRLVSFTKLNFYRDKNVGLMNQN